MWVLFIHYFQFFVFQFFVFQSFFFQFFVIQDGYKIYNKLDASFDWDKFSLHK